ncbi:putative zinc finger protein [Orchesella cincta]|uniref:Putative zinc finger protein n=1 Tax=Orchesella cincta TaxID=48709 RepID=A0A1D2MHW7_ORCCI|nr:putative zinc finger protein [Orchesella cincta]
MKFHQIADSKSVTTSNSRITAVQGHTKVTKCQICSKQYESRQGLAYHMKSHTNEKPHKCEPCGKFFKCQSSLRSHTQHKHSNKKSYSCLQCPASFANSSNLTRHTRVVHEKDPRTRRKCNVCQKLLATSYMPAHMKWHANIMPFSCIICDKPFHAQNNLRLHIKTNHLMERPYSCSKCPATFPLRFELTHHILRVHKPEEWFTAECAICGKMLPSDYALNSHMATHTGEKHYKCATCGKRYGSNSALKLHQNAAHDGGRKLTTFCIMCDKGFPTNGALNDHMLVHTRERPFWCELCPSTFWNKSKLEKHFRESKLHNEGGGKLLTKLCIMCEKGFANSGELNKHLFVHTKEKPFWCEQCPSSFCRRDRLQEHIRKAHAKM